MKGIRPQEASVAAVEVQNEDILNLSHERKQYLDHVLWSHRRYRSHAAIQTQKNRRRRYRPPSPANHRQFEIIAYDHQG